MNGAKVVELEKGTLESINKQAPRLWLFGILSSLALNLYKLQSIFERRQIHLRQLLVGGHLQELGAKVKGLDEEGRKAAQSALSDMIDLIIPLSMLGFIDISPGVVGLAGTVTSILGAISLWPKQKSD